MSRVEEIKKQMQELQKELELEELKQNIEYPPLKMSDNYWAIDDEGSVFRAWWSEDGLDKNRYKVGNVFVTDEEARRERDRRILLTHFRQFRDKCNGDWEPDWDDSTTDKFFISSYIFNRGEVEIFIYMEQEYDHFSPFGYFKNEDDAERALELFGDEIKRLFVEEEK